MFNKTTLETFPENTGVYIMKDISGKIIYVGKANNLKKRVNQYFNGQDKRLKIERLRKEIENIEYISVPTELEALILENNLIKENRPKFNTLLKDSNGYPYIEITLDDEYPKVKMSNKITNNNSKYFGPYTDISVVKNIVEILQDNFRLILCKNFQKGGCLYYRINKCSGPCLNKITKEEYNEQIKKIIDILSGKNTDIINEFKKKMFEASNNLEFEKALKYKKSIEDIEYVNKKQILQLQTFENEDIVVSRENVIVVFSIRDGKLLNKKHFFMNDFEETVDSFIKQFYANQPIPGKVLVENELADKEVINSYLNKLCGKKVEILVPKIGNKKKLLNLAIQNADVILNENKRKVENKEKLSKEGIKNIENLLNISIKRIESFDISNTAGSFNVASMVVFEDGKLNQKQYRKFKLNTKGANDYGCMKEVIKRRFTDKKLLETMPSVLFMDGGKGQMSAALKVLEELKLNVPVCGMVKDDNHNTKALLFNNKELEIKKSSYEFKLIAKIQDETHNFAINYHKSLRDKNMVHSKLDDIKGLGPVKKKLLMDKYGSLENIKNATKEELLSIKGITEDIVKQLMSI